jgi:predicted transcriptional regulator
MISNNINTINMDRLTSTEIITLTTDIVAAYVSNNTLSVEEIPAVVNTVFQCMSSLAVRGNIRTATPDPVVPVNQSVFPDYIVCLEDGKQLKMLKRHLKSSYNMTPEQYRERWGLPADYPMVAPNYAKRRSSLAIEIGLGRKRKERSEAA